MKNQWFRFYNDALNNPKVQKLSPVLFKTWVNLLCVACENDGVLPSLEDTSFSLRIDVKTLNKHLKELIACGLIDDTEQGLQPHNWNERQFKSDTSKERTKKYRERLKRRKCDADSDDVVTSQVTPQEQNRTEEERKKERIEICSEVLAPPVDNFEKDLDFNNIIVCFDVCCALLGKEKLDNLDAKALQAWHSLYDMRPIIVNIQNELVNRLKRKLKPPNSIRFFEYVTKGIPITKTHDCEKLFG